MFSALKACDQMEFTFQFIYPFVTEDGMINKILSGIKYPIMIKYCERRGMRICVSEEKGTVIKFLVCEG